MKLKTSIKIAVWWLRRSDTIHMHDGTWCCYMALNPGFIVAAVAPTKGLAKTLAKEKLLHAVYDIYNVKY